MSQGGKVKAGTTTTTINKENKPLNESIKKDMSNIYEMNQYFVENRNRMKKREEKYFSNENRIDQKIKALIHKLPLYDFRQVENEAKWFDVSAYIVNAKGSDDVLRYWCEFTKPEVDVSSLRIEVKKQAPISLEQHRLRVLSYVKPVNFDHLASKGQREIAKYFAEMTKDNIKTAPPAIYTWNKNTTLWESMGFNEFVAYIQNFIGSHFDAMLAATTGLDATDNARRAMIYKSKSKYEKNEYVHGVAKTAIIYLTDKVFVGRLDVCRHVVNFKNGLYDFKQQKFRTRNQNDSFSVCLNFDYAEEPDEEIFSKIRNTVRQICNDEDDIFNGTMSFFGYCMTGETKEEKWLLIIGHTAGNGKSTLLHAFTSCFPIYGKKMDDDFLYTTNTTRHKTLIEIKVPTTMMYQEELKRKLLDTEFVKGIVDGRTVRNKIMHGTNELINFHAKMLATSNHDPKFQNDEGFQRRLLVLVCRNRFVDPKDYATLKGTKGIYLKDKDLKSNFEEDPRYKLAFFHLLRPFACKYYEEGLYIPDEFITKSKELCGMNDPLKDFIEDHYQVTRDPNDRIYKDDLLQAYRKYSDHRLSTVNYLSSELKRFGVQYEKGFKIEGKRGCFLGIKQIREVEKGDDNGQPDDDDTYGI